MRFLLVDEILDLTPGRSVRAITSMRPEEELLQDHFPGFPVVPGVILTEMMGQAAGKCLLAGDPERGRPILAQIKSALFREWVRPGQEIVLVAEIGASRPEFATAKCRAEVLGRTVCSAELMFTFLAPPAEGAPARDEVLERYFARGAGDPSASGDNRAAASSKDSR